MQRGFRQLLRIHHSNSPDTLATLGLEPRTVHKPTVATFVQSHAKAKATRAARHTMGKKAKLAIKA
jgi:hypothetical protein